MSTVRGANYGDTAPRIAVPPSAVTLVTQTRVSPSHDEEFARWQEQVPPLTTVRTAYPAEPFPPVFHPPIQLASR